MEVGLIQKKEKEKERKIGSESRIINEEIIIKHLKQNQITQAVKLSKAHVAISPSR